MMTLLEKVNLYKEIAKENKFEYWIKKFEIISDKIGRWERVTDRELKSIERFENWTIESRINRRLKL